MRLQTVFSIIAALLCAFAAADPIEYFVDCNRTDDSGDGKSEATAFRTIKHAIETAQAGDIITVLPGDYGDDQGVQYTNVSSSASTSVGSRLRIDKNITLRSRDGAATTHIIGKWADSANGMGKTAVRCLTASTACTISGFTFRDGATDSGNESDPVRGGGILASGKNVVVTDCVISNCVGTRGGGAYNGKYIRCKFVGNFASNYGAAARTISAFNCLFTLNARSTGSTGSPGVIAYTDAIVNCTIVNNFQQGVEQVSPGPIVNTVILYNIGGSGGNVYADATNGKTRWKYCVTDLSTVQQYGDNCARSSDGHGVFFSPASGDYRPVSGAMLDGNGSLALAQQYFADYVDGKDLAGYAFCADGATAVSIGAFQEGKSTNNVGSLIVGVDSNYGSFTVNGNQVAISQEYRSDRGLDIVHVGFTAAEGKGIIGYYRSDTGGVDWPLEDDSVYMLTPKTGTCTTTFHGASKLVYVDVSNKGDAYANGSPVHPYWEIVQATTNLNSNSIVMVADGHYGEGGYWADGVTNRVYISNNVWKRIRSMNGASKTFIHGASDTGGNAREGCGPAAVRCAWLRINTQLQGFTLLDGRSSSTSEDKDVTDVRGGGVLFTASNVDDQKLIGVTDCVISNCVASRGAAFHGGIYERCLITKNYAYNNGVTRNGKLSSCLVVGNGKEGFLSTQIIGYHTALYNCTVTGNRSTVGSFSINASAPTPIVASIVSDTDGSNYDITAGLAYCTNNVIGRVQNRSAVDSRYGDPMYADKENGDYRVRADGPAAGFGRPGNLFRATDYTGKPFYLGEDGSFTVGAFTEKLGVITPGSTNAIAGGISPAETIVYVGTTNVTFEATEKGTRSLLGFDVNGEFREDDGTGRIKVSCGPVSGGDGVWLKVNAVYDNNWYVDDVNGDDANTGFSWENAKKTLAAAAALMYPGDTLNVAPGVYRDGTMLQGYTSCPLTLLAWTPSVRARLVVTNGCSVVSRDGPETTFIMGEADNEENGGGMGLGSNAVRCVFLGPNTRLSGFTVTGGRTATGNEDANTSAGGIAGYDYSSLVENCIISNNVSQRGGGMRWGACRNCRFLENTAALSIGNTSCARNVKAYTCLFDNNRGEPVTTDCHLYNCTIGVGNTTANGGKLGKMTWTLLLTSGCPFVNTILAAPATKIETTCMTNCAYADDVILETYSPNTFSVETVNPAVGEIRLDGLGRPQKGSVAIDAGDASLMPEPISDTDLAGGQRIYNNAIDIGCYEYDAREDFARTLKPNGGIEVTNASPRVEQTSDGILIHDGELAADWTRSTSRGTCVFDCAVTGGGLLTVLLNGETFAGLTSADGPRTLEFRNALTANALTFRYAAADGDTDTDGALVSKMAWRLGTVLSVR